MSGHGAPDGAEPGVGEAHEDGHVTAPHGLANDAQAGTAVEATHVAEGADGLAEGVIAVPAGTADASGETLPGSATEPGASDGDNPAGMSAAPEEGAGGHPEAGAHSAPAESRAGMPPQDEDHAGEPTEVPAALVQGRDPHWEPGVHPEDEATTIVTGALPAWEPGVHPDDEATTIVSGAGPAWEPGVHPDDEATTIVSGALPAWEPGVHPDDEATTIVSGAGPVWEPGVHPDDEATTIVSGAGPAWAPGAHPDDEATTIVSGPAPDWEPGAHPDDEATTVVSGPAPDWAPGVHPDDEATVLAGAPPAKAAELSGVAAARGAGDTTAVVPGSLAAGEAMPGQGWFDARLQDFTVALTQDEHGQPRAKEARQMLGAAARDMIARTVLQGGPGAGQEWAADTVLQPDQLLANTYIVRSLIARGGIGEIYRVRHRDLKTEHAVKILLPRYALDPTLLSLMLEEARLLQCVRHEAVVGCQGLLRDVDGRPVLVMDYIRGRTLSGRLRDGPLSTEELVVLARRLAEGLAAIHDAGIVHQDMSPDNVMLSEDSVAAATIIDFGLARPLGSGSSAHRHLDFAGKFSWASPEQLSGRAGEVDARSDLYSLGLILIAAARGYRLDMGHDMESARSARRTVPSLAGIESPVADLLKRLLDPQKTGRPASAAEISGLLAPKPAGLWDRLLGLVRK